MGKLAGLLMIAAGVGTAAYVYPMLGSDQSDRQLADVVAITTGAVPVGQPVPTRPPAIVVKPAGQDAQRVVSAETSPGKLALGQQAFKVPAAAAVVTVPNTDASARTIEARPIEAPQPQAAKRPNRADDEAKIALTREIQRELKRVGCFDGSVDGTWTSETRQAMKLFIDRVNASLPVENPDHILKTLVQGHPGNACGKSCPTGQAVSGDGRCLPTAIIAAPKRVPAPVAVTREAAAPAAKASSWEPKVIPAPQAVQKPQVAAISEPRAAEVKVDRPEPLPGRTSLGAIGVPPPSSPAPVTEAPSQQKRPVVLLKPRAPSPNETTGDTTTASLPTPPSTQPAPSIGAIAAIEVPQKPRARPPAAYRAPPPQRFVSAYSPPPVYRERQRFGPQIFRELERSGR